MHDLETVCVQLVMQLARGRQLQMREVADLREALFTSRDVTQASQKKRQRNESSRGRHFDQEKACRRERPLDRIEEPVMRPNMLVDIPQRDRIERCLRSRLNRVEDRHTGLLEVL